MQRQKIYPKKPAECILADSKSKVVLPLSPKFNASLNNAKDRNYNWGHAAA
jgi:hypothetical protein